MQRNPAFLTIASLFFNRRSLMYFPPFGVSSARLAIRSKTSSAPAVGSLPDLYLDIAMKLADRFSQLDMLRIGKSPARGDASVHAHILSQVSTSLQWTCSLFD